MFNLRLIDIYFSFSRSITARTSRHCRHLLGRKQHIDKGGFSDFGKILTEVTEKIVGI